MKKSLVLADGLHLQDGVHLKLGKILSLAIFLMVLFGSGQQAKSEVLDTAQIIWTTTLQNQSEVWSAKFFHNGDSIIVVEKNSVFIVDAKTGKICSTLNGFEPYRKIQLENGGSILHNNWQKYDLTLRKVVDTVKFEPYGSSPDHLFGIGSFALHPTKDLIYLESSHTSSPWGPNRVLDSNLAVITKSTLRPLKFKSVNGFMNRGIDLSPDGRFLITGELNTACCIGNIATNEIRLELRNSETLDLIKTLYKENGIDVYSMTFSPDGKYFVATTYDEVHIWSTDTWELVGSYYYYYIQFGKLLMSCNSKYMLLSYYQKGNQEKKENGLEIYSLSSFWTKVSKIIPDYRYPDGSTPGMQPLAIDCTNNKLLVLRGVYEEGYYFALSLIDLPEFVTSVGSDEPQDPDLILYPNPTSNEITINFNEPITEQTTIEISDEAGRIIYSNTLEIGISEYKWNTKALSNGMYLCVVRNNNSSRTYKIMVQR